MKKLARPIASVFVSCLALSSTACAAHVHDDATLQGDAAHDNASHETIDTSHETIDTSTQARVVTTDPENGTPELGRGWDLGQQRWKSVCIDGTVLPPQTRDVQSGFKFDRKMSNDTMREELGFGLEGKAQFGVFKASAKADAMRAVMTDDFSDSMTFSSYVDFAGPQLSLKDLTFTPVGLRAHNGNRFHAMCGDEAYVQSRQGARLFLVYKFNFTSKKVAESFKASVSIAGSIGELNAKVESNKSTFAGKASIEMQAFQIGGRGELLGMALNGSSGDGVANVVKCGINDLASCNAYVKNALDYASKEFPKQINTQEGTGGSALGYITEPYETLGFGESKTVPATLKKARRALGAKFQQLVAARSDLIVLGTSTNPPAGLRSWREAIDGDIEEFEDIYVPQCWDEVDLATPTTISACTSMVVTLQAPFSAIYAAIEKMSVEPPPPPVKQPPIVVISSRMNDKALDTNQSKDNGTSVHMWTAHASDFQQWRIYDDGTIRNVRTNKCLDVHGWALADWGKIVTWDCAGGANQKWDVKDTGEIVSRWSGKCLDVKESNSNNGAAVIQYSCNGGNNQKWNRSVK